MSLYARSDVVSVTLSSESGGCGAVHSRPVNDGAPVPVWVLECPMCEIELRRHPHFSATRSEIPETPDEERIRAEREKRGTIDRDNATANALDKLGELPAALKQQALANAQTLDALARLGSLPELMAGVFAQMRGLGSPQGAAGGSSAVSCERGHVNPSGARFCASCGVSLTEAGVRSVPQGRDTAVPLSGTAPQDAPDRGEERVRVIPAEDADAVFGFLTPISPVPVEPQDTPDTGDSGDSGDAAADRSMDADAVSEVLARIREASAESGEPVTVQDLGELSEMTFPQLRDLSARLGVRTARSREEQLVRLAEYLKTCV